MLTNRVINIFFLVLVLALAVVDFTTSVPIWLYIILLISYLTIQAYGAFVLSAAFFLPVKYRGASSNAVAITFDDGPVTGKTEKILEILSRHQTKAAFFCIGNRVKENPQLTRQIHSEGHMLGNHSYWHGKTFDLQSAKKIADELMETDRVITASAGVTPKFFRPPYGVTNPMVASAVRKGNYDTIGWSLRSFDTIIKDPLRLRKRVLSSLKAGDIILFHDYCDSTIEILPSVIDHINKVGLKIVRVDELLNEKAYR